MSGLVELTSPMTSAAPTVMAWWAWVIIWSILALALVGVLAGGAWLLFRKGLRVLDALADLAETASIDDLPERALTAPERAILGDLRLIHQREAARRFRRAERRRLRHERRLARARRLISVDALAVSWPSDWRSTARTQRQRVS